MVSFLLAPYRRYRRLSLGVKILVFMCFGVLAGIAVGPQAQVVQPLGDLFINLLLMAAIPLVFFNLLAGLTSLTDVGALGRLGAKVVLFYLVTTVFALVLGLLAMHLLEPGVGMTLTGEVTESFGEVPRVVDLLLGLVPKNVFAAFANGNVSQVVVFAVFLGLATLLLPTARREPLQRAFDLAAELLRKLVDVILHLGPVGLGALAAATVGQYGSAIFGPLALFIGGVWGAQAAMVVVYMTLLYGFTRMAPIDFFRRTGPLYATTAATCSSLASLVVAFEVAKERLRLPERIYTFTLPLGAQLNKDGTSIMLAGVLLFTAQATGVTFDVPAQVTIVLVGLILSEGSGGIPGGGLVIALIFVQAFNLPVEVAAIVGGIYRLIDMGSTTINCMGDMVGTLIIANSERDRAGSDQLEPMPPDR
ncbi:MAG: dicarboxylate/amino acid:cation symporter [Proteobacteria bacterium]|nr:dicarboxylate/amino acid:cation symporter [Pseudomonadota bacterium]